MIRILLTTSLLLLLANASALAQFSASGDPRPVDTPAFVAKLHPICERAFAEYQAALEPKAFAQTADGRSCGGNFGTRENRDAQKPITGFTWDGIKEQAVRNCMNGKARKCYVTVTNSRVWTSVLPYEEWVQKTREARPQIKDDTTVLDRETRFDGDYEGKMITVNPTTGKPWEGVFKGRAVQGVLEGTVSGPGLTNGRIKANILAGGKVGAGTFFGGRTNYAVDGQIADNVPGDPVKGQTLRATISPLEQGQFPSGTLEAERKG